MGDRADALDDGEHCDAPETWLNPLLGPMSELLKRRWKCVVDRRNATEATIEATVRRRLSRQTGLQVARAAGIGKQALLSISYGDLHSKNITLGGSPHCCQTVETGFFEQRPLPWPHRRVDPSAVVREFMLRLIALWRRVDAARFVRLLVLQLCNRRLWKTNRPTRPPGQLVVASGHVTRGPDVLRMTRFIRGEPFTRR
jgi:hypothetical protein